LVPTGSHNKFGKRDKLKHGFAINLPLPKALAETTI